MTDRKSLVRPRPEHLDKSAESRAGATKAAAASGVTTTRDASVRMPVDYDEFKGKTQIDRASLDEVVEQQGFLFSEVAERHVMAASARDDKADELSRRGAELSREFRANPPGGQKVTDSTTEDYVKNHVDHQKLSAELRSLKREADLWWGLREAFQMRGKMAHELVELHLSSYFSEAGSGANRAQVRDARASVAKEALHRKRVEGREASTE